MSPGCKGARGSDHPPLWHAISLIGERAREQRPSRNCFDSDDSSLGFIGRINRRMRFASSLWYFDDAAGLNAIVKEVFLEIKESLVILRVEFL